MVRQRSVAFATKLPYELMQVLKKEASDKGITITKAIIRRLEASTCKACKQETAGYCATCMYLERMKGEEYGRRVQSGHAGKGVHKNQRRPDGEAQSL